MCFTITDKIIQKCLESYVQNNITEKPLEFNLERYSLEVHHHIKNLSCSHRIVKFKDFFDLIFVFVSANQGINPTYLHA